MAVQWGLGQPQGGGFDYLESLQALGQQQAQRQQMQIRDYGFQQQQRQDTARTGFAEQARGGDFAGARQGAALGGDFDFANALGGLQDDHLKQLAREFDTIGVLHPQLKGIPVEQRAQVALPILRQAGFSDQELAGVDWTDAGLDGAYAMSQSGKAALAARLKQQEARVVGDGGALVNGAGQVLYENQKAPEWQFDTESGSWLQKPGTGQNGGQPGYAPQGAMPQMGAGGPLSAMTAITAQSESGNRDYLPNGQLVTSSAGAQGAMQTMPSTQGDPGYGVAPVRDGSVGEKNRVGREYLAAMVQKYGDPQKAWAAYNAGPGRVDRAIQQNGDNWLAAMPAETRKYVAKNSAQLGGGQQSAPQQPGVVNVRPPRARQGDVPSGYRMNGNRLEPIPGGPADPATATTRNVQSNRKAEADFRKEFEGRKEVKDFRSARTQFNALRDTALNPKATAQDDIAVIFQFMKTLDPTSTVREGEFATAQNAGGIPDTIRNAFNKAQNGERLNPEQRKNMAKTAYRSYQSFRNAYNDSATEFRGYAKDNGVNPDRVARTYTPDKPSRKAPAASGRMAQFKIVKVN